MSSAKSNSIDKEIGEIRVALRSVHETIYKLALQMNNATNIVDGKLSIVDEDVRKVAREVSHIRDNTNVVTSLFPSNTTYLIAFIALDVIIWILAGFLAYKIIINLRGAGKTSQKWQIKYANFRPIKTPQPALIIAEDVDSESVIVRIPQTREIHEPPPYRSSLGRGQHYRRNTTAILPPKYQHEYDEASSLLNEISPDRRSEWTQIVDEK
uniref:Uncharacterized protein n=1 Tax=Panagrolaimus sp. PS1159 TaxID=55785 RepID=A0AC35F4B7_9BILA